jgi:pimeloyl-ACP methyl ester carboxylesterase
MGQIAVAHPARLDDEMLDADVICQSRNRDTYIGLMRCLGTLRGIRLRPHLVLGERWHDLRMPTAFVCGDRDAFVLPRVESAWKAILAANPNIHMVRIPDAGHLVWLDAPREVAHAMEAFLTTASTAGAESIVA